MALTQMLHGKVITIRGNLSYLSCGKQLASYLQVTGFKSCYSCVVCFLCRSVMIFESREIRHLIRLNSDLINK